MHPEWTGTQIGPYRIQRVVGQGAMGVVCEAIHSRLGHRVAIKLLHLELAESRGLVKRFQNEARAIAQVRHPGLVSLIDCGEAADGSLYLVMEYLEGEPLHQRLRRLRRLPVHDALHITRQLASTLAVAHQSGIVHRDLKPSNVILTTDWETPTGERAKLVDFGLAKIQAAPEELSDSTLLDTKTGTLLGTPVYMSPEQCRGDTRIDAKTDVYSLGVMLYEMLASRPPFIGRRLGLLLAEQIGAAPPPISELVPQLDPRIAGMVHQMLAKEPRSRPSMAALEDALQELAPTRRLALARRQRWLRRVWRWLGRTE